MTAAAAGADRHDGCADAFVEMATRLADVARPITLRHYRSALEIEAKADRSPVTIADREAETAMRDLLAARFPDHGVLGEEWGAERIESEYVWVIDPIDGTAAFVTGRPLFGTLVALARRERPILGVIDMPALGERWVGARGRATRAGKSEVRTRPCAALDEAWLAATSPRMFAADESAAFERVCGRVKRAIFGGDCYNYGLVASGHLDLVIEAGLKPYDFCVVAPIIEGAGGSVTDWTGAPLTLASDGRVVAAGDRRLTEAARALLGWRPAAR